MCVCGGRVGGRAWGVCGAGGCVHELNLYHAHELVWVHMIEWCVNDA